MSFARHALVLVLWIPQAVFIPHETPSPRDRLETRAQQAQVSDSLDSAFAFGHAPDWHSDALGGCYASSQPWAAGIRGRCDPLSSRVPVSLSITESQPPEAFALAGDLQISLTTLVVDQLPPLLDADSRSGGTSRMSKGTGWAWSPKDCSHSMVERYHLQQLNLASRLNLSPMPGVDSDSGWLLATLPNVKARVVIDPHERGEVSSFAAQQVANRAYKGLFQLRDIEVHSLEYDSEFVLPYEFIVGRVLARKTTAGAQSSSTSSLIGGGGIRGFWGTVRVSGKTAVRGLPGKFRFRDSVIDGRNPEVVWFLAADFIDVGDSALRLSFTSNSRGNWLGSLAVHLALGR